MREHNETWKDDKNIDVCILIEGQMSKNAEYIKR